MLRRALDAISSGEYSGGDGSAFAGVVENLVHQDRFMALADFEAYIDGPGTAWKQAYRDADAWSRMAILNVANVGFFSSDRSMRDYLDRIWHSESVHVPTRFDKPAAQ